jgi:cadmium resistance protein CadD (predicted permease)
VKGQASSDLLSLGYPWRKCLAGSWSVSHHTITQAIHRWGHWIVPAVYILIGLYILHKAGALSRIP